MRYMYCHEWKELYNTYNYNQLLVNETYYMYLESSQNGDAIKIQGKEGNKFCEAHVNDTEIFTVLLKISIAWVTEKEAY